MGVSMLLRQAAVAACALIALSPLTASASAAPSHDHKLTIKHLHRPERPRDVKERTFDPDALLVQFKPGASASSKDRALSSRGVRIAGAVAGTGYVKVRAKGAAARVLRDLQNDPAVASVSLDYRRQTSVAPNDPGYIYGDQNYLNTVRLPQAWDRTKGSTSQVIAVVDTGVDAQHVDLAGRVVAGYNAITNSSIAATANSDDYGHGSMVAGIAAANTNNGIGVAGVAWTGRIMPIKVLNSQGSGYDSDIAEGVIWAADHGAKIINMSLGGPGDSPVMHNAITYATSKGAVVVVAAGNTGDNTPQYPAAYPEVLAVGATDGAGKLTDFSSWGDWIDVAAPGFDIVSTGNDGQYYIGDGTSFAAPIASGVAALVRTVSPSLTPAQVIARIKATARDAGPRGIDPYYGKGVLDAYYAVGGTWGPEFPQPSPGANEPNDVPARATTFSTSITGTIDIEGDVDWYRWDTATSKVVNFQLAPPAHDPNLAQNFDAILTVYDKDLRQLGQADSPDPAATEKVALTLGTGTYYVAVRNYNGAADTRPYTLSVGTTQPPLFQPAQATDVGSWPESVAIGDVTGDGRNDVLMTTSFYFDEVNDYKLFVFAQNADGTLAAPVKYSTQIQYSNPAGLALLDADGDGRLDVAIATSNGLQILRQTEAGALTDNGVVQGTLGAQHVVSADMDGDGDTDMVLTGSAGIVLLTHEANGSFTPSVVAAEGTGEVEVGDVDGDGRPDVAAIGNNKAVRVYHHTDGGWNPTDHTVVTGYWTSVSGIEVADVTGDGRADVMATIGGNRPGAMVNVFVQNASGGLNAPAVYATVDIPEPVEAADMNGDSRTDVVTAHGGWNTLSVLPQLANGTLGTPITTGIPYASHYNLQGMALGDINGDQAQDVVIADYNSGLVVLRNNSNPTLTPTGEQAWVRSVAPADFTTGASLTTAPTVTFARAVDAASVTASTVRLVDGVTGATVAGTVTYDGASRTAKVTPAAALRDNTPYRLVVDQVRDQTGATQTERFSTTFRTVNQAPGAVSSLKAAGTYRGVTLSWTLPNITDLDQVIVRMAAGTTAPSSPTAGTAVYAGVGTSATAINLTQGTTYTFRVWVKDRSGMYSSGSTVQLKGSPACLCSWSTVPGTR
jgi:type VII secretion-associated serine protease mycosin